MNLHSLFGFHRHRFTDRPAHETTAGHGHAITVLARLERTGHKITKLEVRAVLEFCKTGFRTDEMIDQRATQVRIEDRVLRRFWLEPSRERVQQIERPSAMVQFGQHSALIWFEK